MVSKDVITAFRVLLKNKVNKIEKFTNRSYRYKMCQVKNISYFVKRNEETEQIVKNITKYGAETNGAE